VAQDSWPSPARNERAVTDIEYEKIAQRFSDDGVYGEPSDFAVVSAGTGLSVNVRADVYASVRGHAWYSGSTTDSLPIAANSSGSTRIDWVVLRLDRSTWTVRAVVRQGTPGAGAPAMVRDEGSTGVYEVPLARVTVPAGATSVTVARAELYVGSRLRPCRSTSRPTAPRLGDVAFEIDTGRLILWTGASWTVISSDSGVVMVNSSVSAWSVETDSVLRERNGNVHLRLGSFKRTAGTLSGTSASRLPALIPSQYRDPTRDHYVIGYVTGVEIARITVYSAASDRPGQVWLTQHPGISTNDAVLTSDASWVV
jgi:hypothetical protein